MDSKSPYDDPERLREPRVSGLANLRDLGGHETVGGPTRWRRALRSDGLHELDPDGLAALRALGIATVIDLRSAREVEVQPNPCATDPAFDYVNVPLFEKLSPIDIDASRDDFDLSQRYVEALDTCQSRFAGVFRTIAAAGEGAVLVHCTAGKDRTGLVAAMWLLLAGATQEAVVADYLATERQGRPLLEKLKARNLARSRLPEEVVAAFYLCEARMIMTFINHLTARGGAARYLARCGLGQADLEHVRRHLAG
ncbi:tyrosine-protein phosphatase [Nitratireductor alexandrii]|uniref:tyrosine-protein phosphatase n=1 Tax=Nitratireductor alexandrii TaxID=2448161 RepID=UPI0013DF77C0|nr:tyrosine-protein phosphatase [Nitratireductor alexandrii]